MGHRVTIEGSQYMPTDLLGRGQRATVEVTDTIRKLVAGGGAIVVAGSLDDPDAVAYGEPDRGAVLAQMSAEAAEDDAYERISEFPGDTRGEEPTVAVVDEPVSAESKPRRTRSKSSGES
ncbi:hypothetical protein [Mycobacterium sp. DL440]|uniref:hypothetical protein n=1 Tax=Mycobacterium sp. DL440 TaxID=2675523 RepID=UPI001420B1E8|nr:hypothetical protein [Mycobacterium sp. DL440]